MLEIYHSGPERQPHWPSNPPQERKISGSNPACAAKIFQGSSHTSDLKIGTPVATLPGTWHYRVVLVRLRTGHNRLNSHMHGKLKLAFSPTCPCGQEEQTTEYVLQRCPLFKATREDVWPVSTYLTTKLYGCKQELEKTSFISRAALIA